MTPLDHDILSNIGLSVAQRAILASPYDRTISALRSSGLSRTEAERTAVKFPMIEPKEGREIAEARHIYASLPRRIRAIVLPILRSHNISVVDAFSRRQTTPIIHCRHEMFYAVRLASDTHSANQIGRWFGRDATTVLHGIAQHQRRTGGPILTTYGRGK